MKKGHTHNLDDLAYRSELRKWNSVWKTMFCVVVILLVMIADSNYVSLFTIGFMGVVSVGLGKLHAKEYIHLLTIPLVFILLSGFAIALRIETGTKGSTALSEHMIAYITIGRTVFGVTRQGLLQAIKLMAKALASVSALYMLTLSTPMGELLAVLKKAHIPGVIVELMHLIYHYIFIMLDVSRKQKDTAASRLGYHSYRASIRSFSNGLANLLILSLKRAGTCYDAMESRGYDGELCMLEEEKPIRRDQIVVMAGYGILTACLAWIF